MATTQGNQASARFLCPNCEQRIPDTSTTYDEVLMSSATAYTVGRSIHRVRTRTLSTYGRVWLCGPCSTAYNRMVALRGRGHRLLRWGGIGLVAGALFLALLYAAFQGEDIALALISLPALFGTLAVFLGASFIIIARLRRRRVAHFLDNPNLAHMGAPPERFVPDSTVPTLAAPIQRLTVEDHKRSRRAERLRMALVVAGSFVLVAALVIALSLGLQRQRALGAQSQQTAGPGYSVDFTISQPGWSNGTNGCAFAGDGYHIAPKSAGKGITCFAPAGDFENFTVQATAHLVSGASSADYGLDFRVGDDLTLGNGYLFEITADGRARLDLLQNGALSQLSPIWQFPANVSTAPNDAHTLQVQARGSTLTCLIDGSQVGSYSDTHFSGGRLGLFAGQSSADVDFTSFSVTPA